MKARTIGIVAAAGLAALVSGCKEKPREPQFDRVDWPDSNGSYTITENGYSRIFHHNCFSGKCYDSLINNLEGYGYALFDNDNDGIVEGATFFWENRCTLLEPAQRKVIYRRGDEGTEAMFAFVDTEYASAKKDMGVQ